MVLDLNYFKSLFDAGLPIWILAGGGLLCLILDGIFIKKGALVVYCAGALTLIASLYLVLQQWMGDVVYDKNFFLSDRMTQFFIFVVLAVGLISLFNTYSYLKVGGEKAGEPRGPLSSALVTLILFSIVGQIFLFASDHLIVNFIGLETMSLAIYILVGSKRNDIRSNEAAMKYFVMGSVASAILLYGIALLYGSFGVFQLSQISHLSVTASQIFLPKIAVVLILTGLCFKVAVVPFHFWVPDVYEGAPAPITGFMATGVKAASFAFFIRILSTLNFLSDDTVATMLTLCVILTLIVGNLGALVQDNIKRMLAYSSIAHAGYLLLGLVVGFKGGKFDPEVTSAVLFYLIGYSFMTLGAFAVLSVMVRDQKETCQFSDLTGLGYSRPVLAATFSLFMISLLGIPPTVGFVGKYGIFSYAVLKGHIGLAVFGIVMSLVSAYYYLRPLVAMYFRGKVANEIITDVPLPLMFSLVFCSVAVILLGVNPIDYIKMALMAAGALK